jgi:Fur family ferric uptake transcriptional regulator
MSYNTKPKEYISQFLENHKNKRFSIKDLDDWLKNNNYNVNLATIYRNIDKLVKDNVLLKHQNVDNGYATYQYIENEKCLTHFHFECIKCGRVSHLGAKETNDFLKMIKRTMFFEVEPQNTYIRGICNNCKNVFINF